MHSSNNLLLLLAPWQPLLPLLLLLLQSNDKLEEFKQIAAALQPPGNKAVTGSALSMSAAQQRMSGVLGAPPPAKREIGDCYVWGGWGDAEVGDTLCAKCDVDCAHCTMY
jgi:hypothetical protein